MLDNELEQIVARELDVLGFECVKLEITGSSKNPVIRLYIDKPGGVTVGDCSLVSRTVGLLLDKEDPFPGRYLLEVTSPGRDRPLVTEAHFERFQGETARIQAKADAEKITYTGQIRSCINGVLTLGIDDDQNIEIELAAILKASLVGQEYKIDKKTKRSKREKRVNRAARTERGVKRKGDQR
jgi:ribosome maturation factor RimP